MLQGHHHAYVQEASLGSRLQKRAAGIYICWSVDLCIMADHSILLVPRLRVLMQDLRAERIKVTIKLGHAHTMHCLAQEIQGWSCRSTLV